MLSWHRALGLSLGIAAFDRAEWSTNGFRLALGVLLLLGPVRSTNVFDVKKSADISARYF